MIDTLREQFMDTFIYVRREDILMTVSLCEKDITQFTLYHTDGLVLTLAVIIFCKKVCTKPHCFG